VFSIALVAYHGLASADVRAHAYTYSTATPYHCPSALDHDASYMHLSLVLSSAHTYVACSQVQCLDLTLWAAC